ncbi:hypothetical protein FisN_1Lh220 [Fistulifera solaris]|uniref:Uncharacterized protein n=1 Tax=Fistulifera solaris TaxID=1519565 RepID=A0A1Z5K4F5_FISSO|nr:hypothetical protein FisN_1Lh220 [Fistulifera solaris]|eukprot:GAX21104.1 hypothetical protein FisN_1Lh220 [Fistulifera solaris]
MIQRQNYSQWLTLVLAFLLCALLIQIEASWVSRRAPSYAIIRAGGSDTLAGKIDDDSNATENTVTVLEHNKDSREEEATTSESYGSNEENGIGAIHNDTAVLSESSFVGTIPAFLETTTTTVFPHTEDTSALDLDAVAISPEPETDIPLLSEHDLATAMDRAAQMEANGDSRRVPDNHTLLSEAEMVTSTLLNEDDAVIELEASDNSTFDLVTTTLSLETETTTPALSEQDLTSAMDRVTELRAKGKSLHDRKKFKKAALRFSEAAQSLFPFLESSSEDEEDDNRIMNEYATCRLHESLCQLKCEEYEEAKSACTAVLELVESEGTGATPALRARAFYRRAKAELELGETADALQDARSAAFLGDSKAVALYGRLMRESSQGSSEAIDLSGSNALLESLLKKSSNDIPASPMDDMKDLFTSSLLSNMMGSRANNEGGVGSLAKSVLSSLSKRLDKDETQEQICNVLQNTSGPQLRQMAGMAGFPLDDYQAAKLAAICKGVTPKLLRRLLRSTKILIYAGRVMQKVLALLSKYRTIIMILFIAAWAKSAILRPLPVSKRARKLAQQALAAVP